MRLGKGQLVRGVEAHRRVRPWAMAGANRQGPMVHEFESALHVLHAPAPASLPVFRQLCARAHFVNCPEYGVSRLASRKQTLLGSTDVSPATCTLHHPTRFLPGGCAGIDTVVIVSDCATESSAKRPMALVQGHLPNHEPGGQVSNVPGCEKLCRHWDSPCVTVWKGNPEDRRRPSTITMLSRPTRKTEECADGQSAS